MKAKLVKENLNNLYDKSYKITLRLIDDNPRNLRYLIEVTIPGIYPDLVQNYGLGRSEEVINGMKDALYDFISEEFFGGTEPTFTNEETYEWWENLNDSYFDEKINLINKPETKNIFEN